MQTIQEEYEAKGNEAKEWWRKHPENLSNQGLAEGAHERLVMGVLANMTYKPIVFQKEQWVWGPGRKRQKDIRINKQIALVVEQIERIERGTDFVEVAAEMLNYHPKKLSGIIIAKLTKNIKELEDERTQ